ncbi:MAG: ArgR family transcriptional regulator [Colwellia sp.]|nr:ArgR family transcriptional regulator [Colwellia sp.]
MTVVSISQNTNLITAFKIILKEKEYSSQHQLAFDLSLRGFENISQPRISRMIAKIGVIRVRNSQNKIIYKLPDEQVMPRISYAIDTMALSVKNSGTQIILKTGAGGALLIARVLDSLENSFGILGTIAGDDTVLIVPSDIERINDITKSISVLLRIDNH